MQSHRNLMRIVPWALLLVPALLGNDDCRPATTTGEPDGSGGEVSGGEGGGGAPGGERCGPRTCDDGMVCCNALCGICTPPGGVCIQGCADPGGEQPPPKADAGTPNGNVCGGIAGVGCARGQFCNYETSAGGDGCGEIADAQGVCQPIPEACTLEYAPVCGCDGNTYSNACSAHGAGVSVAAEGECDGQGQDPGGEACGDTVCAEGLVCCNALCGLCAPPGHACIQGCEAPQGSGTTCGGIASLTCGDGEFCNYEPPIGLGCDGTVSDTAGKCQTTPWGCTKDWTPVCGCDRVTYGNRCEAHAAGMSVLHEGMCTVIECEAIGGKARYSDGASIPSCSPSETDHGPFSGPNGEIPIEPTRCCVP